MSHDLILKAFSDLSTCRNVGMSLGQIPWTAINEYSEVNNFEGGAKKILIECILFLDSEYLKEINKESKAKRDKK